MLVKDPIYHQLRQLLRELIGKGDFAPGDRFLTERDVATRFGVSRTTANKALSSLVADDTLEFRKGVGSFVRPAVLGYELRSLVSFSDKAVAAGRTPKTEIIAFRRLQGKDAPKLVVSQLAPSPTGGLFFAERLRFADEVPVILERRYIVEKFCPQLSRHDLEGSLYGAWTTNHKLVITGAQQTIRAVNLSKEEAGLLKVKQGSAALVVLALGFIDNGRPLWWEETLYRADAYEFHSRLGGLQPPQPPTGHLFTKDQSLST